MNICNIYIYIYIYKDLPDEDPLRQRFRWTPYRCP